MAAVTNPSGQSQLSQEQILQRTFDETTDKLRTDASFSGSFEGDLDVEIDAADGDNISLANPDGSKRVGVTTDPDNNKNGLDVNVINQLRSEPTGLNTAIKTSAIFVTDVPVKVPSVALVDRNTMSIRVMGADTVYFGGYLVTVNNGYPKFQFEEIIADIKDSTAVDIWAVCETGKTSELRIMEIA